MLRLKSLALCLLLILPAPALADPPAGFAERVERLRESLGVPGATIAIVENGRVTMTQGFGIRQIGRTQRVDADTIFATGSTGKAFTVAALALLVDQGRIRWDDKVIDHMPDFRMWDPWVTREMTIRDLLVHRSGLGLGAGDLLFVPRSDLSRAETVRRLRHIRPATSFRSGYAYDNVLYMVAGQLIEEVTGQTWEAFVRRNIFRPLGMTNSTVDDAGRLASRNYARPHARLNGPIRGTGDQEMLGPETDIAANAAPAGGLAISANDMVHWLNAQLARGALPDGGRLFSEAQAREMWQPVVIQPIGEVPENLRATQPMFDTYALGWDVRDYRGARIIWHGGAVFGSLAAVVLIPERHVGFYIAVNSEEGEMVRGFMYELIDHYLGLPRDSWPEKLHDFVTQRRQAAVASLQAPQAQPADIGPSLPLARYAGDYSDPWYGTINIREENGALTVAFPHTPGLTATLEHWQYETFRTRFNDRNMEPAYVTFQLDAEGKVDRITMRAISPLADFSFDYHDLLFTPVAAAGAAPSP
ncbi:serine hydrolase [Sphingosinicella sp. LHD-64]|uniref:serine hydrolase n=1 Tax=Sphingosinicella sp. LHD-64 TaxID=3072139 RepID=UPI002810381D|nr:serine hydrolase [Sphingosinicella sp. LHD-64]MDQ8756607.1 serine hydrolase [Sphingosinicella sp. LHD-64]